MLARSHFQAVFFLSLSLLVAAPLAAYAQDRPARVSERLRHRDRLAAVDLPANTVAAEFTVAPAARVRAVRRAPARQGLAVEAPPAPPVPPDPVMPETMDLVGNALGGGGFGGPGGFQSPGPPVLDNIELTPRRPWFNEKGNIRTNLAYTTSTDPIPSWDFNTNFPGAMTVNLKVEEGATYLVDFSVSSWGSGTYRVETDSGDQEFADNQGKLEHVLVALNASESGWVSVRMNREGTGYYTYAVIVNRME